MYQLSLDPISLTHEIVENDVGEGRDTKDVEQEEKADKSGAEAVVDGHGRLQDQTHNQQHAVGDHPSGCRLSVLENQGTERCKKGKNDHGRRPNETAKRQLEEEGKKQ